MEKYGLRSRVLSALSALNLPGKWRSSADSKAVLMVCTANICRSPMAEGILQQRLVLQGLEDVIKVDSAGTHVFQRGHRADPRGQKVAFERGVDLIKSRARKIRQKDFTRYDYILAMDEDNFQTLGDMCPQECLNKLFRVMDFAPEFGSAEVPDPYFSNIAAFETVFDMLDVAMGQFLQEIHGEKQQG